MKICKASIIIPVYNQWQFTRQCLKAIAQTLGRHDVEIVVVDNGSSDVTREGCPVLGRDLFGANFQYVRCEKNINFGPASNLGAKGAKGEYLIFLNNDTVPLQGWYGSLLEDFQRIPSLGATGPLLVYPPVESLGYIVQHLGVYVSPFGKVGHLYEGIPADSPLARKRRFFQVITAACMVMPRSLFWDMGGFDENYRNGFEDVDLCAKINNKGYKLTCNPDPRVIHFQGQTQGREDAEDGNARYFEAHARKLLHPDWQQLIEADGYLPGINDWLELNVRLSPQQQRQLAKTLNDGSRVAAGIKFQPFWYSGWRKLATESGCGTKSAIANSWYKLFGGPVPAFAGYDAANAVRNFSTRNIWFNTLAYYSRPLTRYIHIGNEKKRECAAHDFHRLAGHFAHWLAHISDFASGPYKNFMEAFWKIVQSENRKLPIHEPWAYSAWLFNNLGRPLPDIEKGPGISILMPVYNPEPAHLVAALDSILAQAYPNWELCIADDASTNPEVAAILRKYASKDARIKVEWRKENGNISAATNSALAMASKKYVALMDQDDLLEPEALVQIAKSIEEHPEARLFFSDEDKLYESGNLGSPHFKPDWDDELIAVQNYVCHLSVYQTERLREIGGFDGNYDGAQDYEMLLRYIKGLQRDQLIHIPQILYHWRMHERSTAKNMEVKPEAAANSAKASQTRLENAQVSVRSIPGYNLNRIVYPFPSPSHGISIIIDSPQAGKLAETWKKYAGRDVEIILSNVQDLESSCNSRLGGNLAARLNAAAATATGEVLGFVTGAVVPDSAAWAEEIIPCIMRPYLGACGGRILVGDQLLDAGILIGSDGKPGLLFEGMKSTLPYYFGWQIQARTVPAVNGLCLFTRKNVWTELHGVAEERIYSPLEDYCFRLKARGLRVVWWPFAHFHLKSAKPVHQLRNMLNELEENWRGQMPPCNPNIKLKNGELLLSDADDRAVEIRRYSQP